MFTPGQEKDLGDVIAEQNIASFSPIENPELTQHLREVGERLVAHLPPSGLTFRFYLSDAPIANAFSVVGGRVYVTRKLVSVFRDDDELAGVMGHELGHIVTHQQAKLYTRIFHDRMGISDVKDRKDIFDKYNRMLDEWSKHGSFHYDPEEQQQEADRIGVEAVVRAGYSPQALADFWDKFSENKGKMGSWFSEFLQSTPPNTKRYREMVKEVAALPPGCKDRAAAPSTTAFREWQQAVLVSRGVRAADVLHNVIWKRTLEPSLQDTIHTLRFSPDGKYVLAQDSGNIYILTHQPFKVLFRIDAYDAYPAKFTPDSTGVVVYDRSLSVERWDIGSQERISVNEVYVHNACMQTLLSPDGKTLACYRSSKDLDLVDVATGDHLIEKKQFLEGKASMQWGIASVRFIYTLNLLNMDFSPDGRYFVASLRNENSLAYDVNERHEIPVPGGLKNYIGTAFAFITPGRLVGYAGIHGEKSAIVEFPSGRVIKSVDLGGARPTPAAHGDYILIRPIKDNAVGILDPNTNQIVGGSKQSAMDVFDQQYVVEMKNGHLGLFGNAPAPLAEAALSGGSFGKLRTVAVSDDLTWLAISGRGRGGVWDVSSGSRVLNLREFRGSYVGTDGTVLADFPPNEPTPRSIARIALPQKQFSEAMRPPPKGAVEEGPYLVTVRRADDPQNSSKEDDPDADMEETAGPPVEGVNLRLSFEAFQTEPPHNMVLEVRQIQSGAMLWSRVFQKELPRRFISSLRNTMVLLWPMNQGAAKGELSAHPEWKAHYPNPKERDLLIEVLELSSGRILGGFVLDTGDGSFFAERVIANRAWVVVHDNHRRSLVFTLSDGTERGHLFGKPLTVSNAAGLLCLQNTPTTMEIYDLATLSKTDEFSFSRTVSVAEFVEKEKRVLVLTSDQTAYLMDLSSAVKVSAQ